MKIVELIKKMLLALYFTSLFYQTFVTGTKSGTVEANTPICLNPLFALIKMTN